MRVSYWRQDVSRPMQASELESPSGDATKSSQLLAAKRSVQS